MEVSAWVPTLIAFWLAAQLPLGMAIGASLRRAAVLSTVEIRPMAAARRAWPEMLPTPVL
jgi:hypothetical protein